MSKSHNHLMTQYPGITWVLCAKQWDAEALKKHNPRLVERVVHVDDIVPPKMQLHQGKSDHERLLNGLECKDCDEKVGCCSSFLKPLYHIQASADAVVEEVDAIRMRTNELLRQPIGNIVVYSAPGDGANHAAYFLADFAARRLGCKTTNAKAFVIDCENHCPVAVAKALKIIAHCRKPRRDEHTQYCIEHELANVTIILNVEKLLAKEYVTGGSIGTHAIKSYMLANARSDAHHAVIITTHKEHAHETGLFDGWCEENGAHHVHIPPLREWSRQAIIDLMKAYIHDNHHNLKCALQALTYAKESRTTVDDFILLLKSHMWAKVFGDINVDHLLSSQG